MKKLLNNIVNVFKKKEKNINEINIQQVCSSAKGELGSFCQNENINHR